MDEVVTAPLNKEAMNLSVHSFPGHTVVFANLSNTERFEIVWQGIANEGSMVEATRLALKWLNNNF
ncbi:MAG: hypothetical protein WCP85_06110 [Mariniphaga sp.]